MSSNYIGDCFVHGQIGTEILGPRLDPAYQTPKPELTRSQDKAGMIAGYKGRAGGTGGYM